MRHLHAALALALFSASCAAPENSTLQRVDEVPVTTHAPSVFVSPSVWETAGASLQPTLRIDQQRTDDTQLRLVYRGDAGVEVPQMAVIPAGSTEIVAEPFGVAEGAVGAGVVDVYWVSPTAGDVLVTELPVLMVDTIIESFEIHRAEALVSPDEWASSFVVVVNMVAPPKEHAAGVAQCRSLQLDALVPKQGRFQPGTEVLHEVSHEAYPNIPREIQLHGNRFATIVSVEHPSAPPLKRAYLKLIADVGGHQKTKHVPLRF